MTIQLFGLRTALSFKIIEDPVELFLKCGFYLLIFTVLAMKSESFSKLAFTNSLEHGIINPFHINIGNISMKNNCIFLKCQKRVIAIFADLSDVWLKRKGSRILICLSIQLL